MAQKTVLELDLVGYSDVARSLEQNVGVEVVASFNDQIQGFVDAGLVSIGANRSEIVRATTGDGAILVFEQASDAHKLAVSVLERTRTHNAAVTVPSAQRWFRIGLASGELSERPSPSGGVEIAGVVVANAVRLEAAALPGQIVADLKTVAALPDEVAALYGSEEVIKGKRNEELTARRCTILPFESGENLSPSIQSLLELFDFLNPRDQLDRLMMLIHMPQPFHQRMPLNAFLGRTKERHLGLFSTEYSSAI